MSNDVSMENPRAERVKAIAQLAKASGRKKRNHFLVEGPLAVREAVTHAPERVVDVYLSVDAAQRHGEITDITTTANIYTHLCSPQVLRAMSADSQGVVAVVRQQVEAVESLMARKPRLIAALAEVRDPGNAGTVIRAADAAGADGVVLSSSSVDIHNPKVVRSSVGSLFHLPQATGVDIAATAHAARGAGLQVLAADGAAKTTLDDVDLAAGTMWIFGNEAHGLSAAERSVADQVVRIPIYGKAESLNLAMAATICLYSSAKAQQQG